VAGRNPFGDDEPAGPKRASPFADDDAESPDPAVRIEHAARKIRLLRTQLGAEGLTLSATRTMIDEVTAALEAAARAIRTLRGE
jgi:hypothetical protein